MRGGQCLDLDPGNGTVLANRSLCWMRLGQSEKALADAREARKLRPDWSKACYREGSALRLLEASGGEPRVLNLPTDRNLSLLMAAVRGRSECVLRGSAAGLLQRPAGKGFPVSGGEAGKWWVRERDELFDKVETIAPMQCVIYRLM